jgi:hypothetical protein
MSKKATRRAARQAFPKAQPKPDRFKNYGTRPPARSRTAPATKRELKPPSLKRAAIQGAILVALYLILVGLIWKQPGTTALTYVILGIGGFIAYTAVAYGVDKFIYQRRLRKLKGSSK